VSGSCPLYTRKRTLRSATAMSALCQKRTLTSYSITLSVSARGGTVFGANEPQEEEDADVTDIIDSDIENKEEG
jgi:hypothetical protein